MTLTLCSVSVAPSPWRAQTRLVMRATVTHVPIMGALGIGNLGDDFAELLAWGAPIEALPGVNATFPPHWQDAA